MIHHSVTAGEQPDKPAIIMGRGETVSYGAFTRRVNQYRRHLEASGLQPGDHVAILMENAPDFLIFTMAAMDSGLLLTPISVFLQSDEIEYIVNNCEAKFLLASAKYAGIAEAVRPKTPNVAHYRSIGGDIPGYDRIEPALDALSDAPMPYGVAGNFMFYSSGTTGRPKGIGYHGAERNVLESDPQLAAIAMALQLNPNARYLSPAPLYHSAPGAGCITALVEGATVIIMEQFDPETALQLIQEHKATTSQWVPTMFVRLLKLPEAVRKSYDVSSLKWAVHAAAPCSPDTKEAMIKWWGDAIVEYWGASETGVITFITAPESLAQRGSVGRAVRGSVYILDDDDNPLPPNEIGTIHVKTDVSFEYHGEPEKTAESTSKQGYQAVGDTGYLNEEGYLFLTGRKSHMIISGGVNIYPEETENRLVAHPDVLDVAVIGVPHEEFGEEVKAIVQLVDPSKASPDLEAALIGYCREAISTVKCPRSIDFVTDLPRTPTGKLRKHEIRAPYWADADRTI